MTVSSTEKAARETVLIVDDDTESILVLTECLQGRYRIRVAKSGDVALRMVLSDSPPDLITMDVVMPGMDGYETCRRIKATDQGQDIPVLFLTSQTDLNDEIMGFAAGAVDYIQKPPSPTLVQARVGAHLELHRARTALRLQNNILLERARVLTEMERLINHDLRNGLAVLLSVPERLLVEPDLNSHQRRSLEIAARAGQKMASLLSRSSEFWKMEQGTISATYHPVALRLVWREVLEAQQGQAEKKRLVFSGAAEWDDAWVNGDETLLYSLCLNLVKNAIEAAPSASEIQVSLTVDGHRATMVLTNQGAIPAVIRNHIFEKNITHGKEGGSGLGCYTAALIAQAHGGRIEATVIDDAQTRIRVFIPLLHPSVVSPT